MGLHSSAFTILSVDNIDVLASYAAVTSKGVARSWHGTSIMAQQNVCKDSRWGEYSRNV